MLGKRNVFQSLGMLSTLTAAFLELGSGAILIGLAVPILSRLVKNN